MTKHLPTYHSDPEAGCFWLSVLGAAAVVIMCVVLALAIAGRI